MDNQQELTYNFLLNYYIKHQIHHQKLPKVPQYTRDAYKKWYERNNDNDEFKQKRVQKNRQQYQKRKERKELIEKSSVVKVETN